MLACEDGRGYENSRLFSLNQTFKYCPCGNLCLAVPDISAEQPVHGFIIFHIGFDFRNRSQLVFSFLVRKILLKLLLPNSIRRKRVPLLRLSLCIEFDKFVGHLGNRRSGSRLCSLPLLASELI